MLLKEYLLKDLVYFEGGNAFSLEYQNEKHGEIPFIKVSDMNNRGNAKYISCSNNYVSRSLAVANKWNIIPKGSIVFAKIGAAIYLNRTRILAYDSIIDNNMMAAIPKAEISSEYLYLLFTKINYSRFINSGFPPSLNMSLMRSMKLNIHEIEMQLNVSIMLMKWDKSIETLDKLIEAKKKLKQGLMQKLLTGQIRFPGFGKPVTKAGDLPEGWTVKKLGDVADIIMGSSPSSDGYNDKKIGLPLIQGNDDIENEETCPKRWTSVITKTCDIDDIIMTVRAPVGEIAISKHKACIGRGVCAVKPSKIDNKYLYYLLKYISHSWFSLGQGSTFDCISKKDIENKSIILPQLKEQVFVGKILSSIDNQLKNLDRLKQLTNQQKKGLMYLLFK